MRRNFAYLVAQRGVLSAKKSRDKNILKIFLSSLTVTTIGTPIVWKQRVFCAKANSRGSLVRFKGQLLGDVFPRQSLLLLTLSKYFSDACFP
jgi:hypothetical protein